ncbi:MAG: helix-turn-helix domain-containing protein [Oscillospiraceae bacterium]|nr:helix-turn-helix domain-containing protein [Oscillospiraceae bacterium]
MVVELLLGGGGEVGGDDGEGVGSQGLEDNGGNQSKAAAQLGISRSTLWRYLKQLDEKRLV